MKINKNLLVCIWYTFYVTCILGILGVFSNYYMYDRVVTLVLNIYGILGIGFLMILIILQIRDSLKCNFVDINTIVGIIACTLPVVSILTLRVLFTHYNLNWLCKIIDFSKLSILEFIGFSTMCILLTVGVFNVIREMLITFLKIFSQDKNKD